MSLALSNGWRATNIGGTQRSAALSRIVAFENTMHKRLGSLRSARYTRLYNYYTQQNLPPDNIMQPLGINYVKSIIDKHVAYLWGQYTKDIITVRVKPRDSDEPEDATAITIRKYIERFLDDNNKDAVLFEASQNGSIFGDSILRLRWDPVERRVCLESLQPEWFHCRWDITNTNQLTEVIIAYPIDRQDAMDAFGTAGNSSITYNATVNSDYMPGFGIFWEHWTPTSFRVWVDDVLIAEGANPFMRTGDDGTLYPGILPFVHIPNMRAGGEYFGWSDAEHVIYLQDELNRRMADMGDTVNNHAHPIVTVSNFSGDTRDLPVGPDVVWNMGRDGKADLLQWDGTPPAVMEYIELCRQMMFDTANVPQVAFGHGMRGGSGAKQGGGNSSSAMALTVAMMPIIERATGKRIFWKIGLRRVIDFAIFIHDIMDPGSLPFTYETYRKYDTEPVFASILPRDRLQIVNETVARSNNYLQSIESALEALGEEDISAEFKRIKSDARFKAEMERLSAPPAGGKNSDKGMGGSPGINGPGASNRKPGSPAKDANSGTNS